MDLRLYSKGERVRYVPKWKGERERSSKGELPDPITAVITPLTRGELKRYLRAAADSDLDEIAGELFSKHVVEIKNLSIGGEPIASGEQLWKLADSPPETEELISELLGAILDSSTLSEGELKK